MFAEKNYPHFITQKCILKNDNSFCEIWVTVVMLDYVNIKSIFILNVQHIILCT